MPLAKPIRPIIADHDVNYVAACFWSKVGRGTVDECWPWRGETNAKGYGRFYIGDVRMPAHRFGWVLVNGVDPDPAEVIMHRCDNPACCNPHHLQAGSCRDNVLDCLRKGRRNLRRLIAGGLCRHGHALTSENIKMRYDKRHGRAYPACRNCAAESSHNRWVAERARRSSPPQQ